MAPRNRNIIKKHRRNHRKEVRFGKKEYPVKKPEITIKPRENYENLILHYLTKLKRLFKYPDHPTTGTRENSAIKMRKEQADEKAEKKPVEINPNKYTAHQSSPRPGEHMDVDEPMDDMGNEIKDKVYNVVNAALEYGFANNVLERRGNCFILKDKRNPKIANRQPTPGPNFKPDTLKKVETHSCTCSVCRQRMPGYQHSFLCSSTNIHKPSRPYSADMSKMQHAGPHYPVTRKSTDSTFKGKLSHRSRSLTVHRPRDCGKRICQCPKCLRRRTITK